jgi:hypothetical protein
MSRTFRCRHLPRVARSGGRRYTFNHIIDGSARRYGWRTDWDHAESILGPCPSAAPIFINKGSRKVWKRDNPFDWHGRFIIVPGALRPSQEYFEWNRMADAISWDTVRPISDWHPYQRNKGYGRYRTEYKRKSNRALRRRARMACHAWEQGNEAEMPNNYEVFNTWDYL